MPMNPKTTYNDEIAHRLGVSVKAVECAQAIVREGGTNTAKLVDLIALELHAAGGPAMVPIRNVKQE